MFESTKAKVMAASVPVTVALATLPSVAFAEGETPSAGSTVATQMGTLATQVQTDATSAITQVLPAIIGVVGIGIVVAIGIKWVGKMRKA